MSSSLTWVSWFWWVLYSYPRYKTTGRQSTYFATCPSPVEFLELGSLSYIVIYTLQIITHFHHLGILVTTGLGKLNQLLRCYLINLLLFATQGRNLCRWGNDPFQGSIQFETVFAIEADQNTYIHLLVLVQPHDVECLHSTSLLPCCHRHENKGLLCLPRKWVTHIQW